MICFSRSPIGNKSKEPNDEDEVNREVTVDDAKDRTFHGRQSQQCGVGGNEMQITQRNLRIREDVPNYFTSLDLNSAFYDSESRSMRFNSFPAHVNPDSLPYAGDNAMRVSGDTIKYSRSRSRRGTCKGEARRASILVVTPRGWRRCTSSSLRRRRPRKSRAKRRLKTNTATTPPYRLGISTNISFLDEARS